MAAPQPLWIFDLAGAPKADAVPGFVAGFGYVGKDGSVRAQPIGGIVNLGGGQYSFQPSDADEAAGTCAVIDCGVGTSPRYQYIDISTKANQFALYVPLDAGGNLGAGAPTVGSYLELGSGAARPPPSVDRAGAFELYTITPTSQDAAIGVGLRLDSASGNTPRTVNASFSGGPVSPSDVSSGGAIDDLCDAVEMLESGTYTVKRRDPAGYVRGRRVPSLETIFDVDASVQPASGLEVQRLPEGKRNRETMVVFSCVELKTAQRGLQEPDILIIDGALFEVESVKRWAALGNYYRAVVTRTPGS